MPKKQPDVSKQKVEQKEQQLKDKKRLQEGPNEVVVAIYSQLKVSMGKVTQLSGEGFGLADQQTRFFMVPKAKVEAFNQFNKQRKNQIVQPKKDPSQSFNQQQSQRDQQDKSQPNSKSKSKSKSMSRPKSKSKPKVQPKILHRKNKLRQTVYKTEQVQNKLVKRRVLRKSRFETEQES